MEMDQSTCDTDAGAGNEREQIGEEIFFGFFFFFLDRNKDFICKGGVAGGIGDPCIQRCKQKKGSLERSCSRKQCTEMGSPRKLCDPKARRAREDDGTPGPSSRSFRSSAVLVGLEF